MRSHTQLFVWLQGIWTQAFIFVEQQILLPSELSSQPHECIIFFLAEGNLNQDPKYILL